MRRHFPILFLSLLSIFLVGIFLLRYLLIGQAVYGDGIYYYAYTRSIVKDHDIHFENEFEHRYGPDTNNNILEVEKSEFYPDTLTNYVSNKYPIGPGLLWIPVFVVADIIANFISLFNKGFPNNGYSDIYQISVGLFNISSVILGLIILYKSLLHFFNNKISLLVCGAAALGSNLFYYTAIDAINSHSISFLFATIYFYQIFKKSNNYLLIGFLSGIMALIRTQDAVFLLFTFIYIIYSEKNNKRIILASLKSLWSFLIIFSIQLISWKIIYGSFVAIPYISSYEGFNFLQPHILDIFLNNKVGMLIWTPFYLISIVGLIINFKSIPKLLIIFAFLQIYLISSWSGWSQGESFGIRMILSIIPIFSIGFSLFIKKLNTLLALQLIILLVVFNFLAVIYFLIVVQNSTSDRGTNTQTRAIENLKSLFRD